MKILKLVLVTFLALLLCTSGIVDAQEFDEPPLPGQVFLRNVIGFTQDRTTGGASASFVEIGDKLYIITAKHLLGPSMGIEPAVDPTTFTEQLDYWRVRGNDSDEVLASVTDIVFPNNNDDEDVVLLTVDAGEADISSKILPIAVVPPAQGDTVFVIGCPYSERDACAQNIYKGKIKGIVDGNLVVADIEMGPDRLAGFSGAAMVNNAGEIVAVVRGGKPDLMVATLVPEWVRQIEE